MLKCGHFADVREKTDVTRKNYKIVQNILVLVFIFFGKLFIIKVILVSIHYDYSKKQTTQVQSKLQKSLNADK